MLLSLAPDRHRQSVLTNQMDGMRSSLQKPLFWADFLRAILLTMIRQRSNSPSQLEIPVSGLAGPFPLTAVKSNALAELMNRASKIHWKNLSLTLNGRNSETKNDKNNPKVPFFQYVQLLRNISFLLKWSFLAKICCCCQMCYFPKLSIFFKMCVVCKMFGLGHNVRFFQNGFCQNVCFW